MIGRQQAAPVWRFIACAMLEDINLLSLKLPFALQGIQISIEPDLPQCDDHLGVLQSRKFLVEIRCAVPEFLGKGFVVRRSTAYGGRDVEIAKHESVVAVRGVRLTRKSGFVEHRIHKVPGSVPCERTPGAVGAVGTGGETENYDSRIGIAESGHAFCPVLPIAIGTALLACNLFAIAHQPRAAGAGDDFSIKFFEPEWESQVFSRRPMGA